MIDFPEFLKRVYKTLFIYSEREFLPRELPLFGMPPAWQRDKVAPVRKDLN